MSLLRLSRVVSLKRPLLMFTRCKSAEASLAAAINPPAAPSLSNFKHEIPHEYAAGSEVLRKIEEFVKTYKTDIQNVPIMIDGEKCTKGVKKTQFAPDATEIGLTEYYAANQSALTIAIRSATNAILLWENTPFSKRFDIWEKAAKLMAGEYRAELIASSMLSGGKILKQAEKDVCLLLDLMHINPLYAAEAMKYDLYSTNPQVRNRSRLCGLGGFVAAITPFNSLATAANQVLTALLMGNPVVWKPSDHAILSNYVIYKIMREAGLPDGVLNFVPTEPAKFSSALSCAEGMAGITFGGSLRRFYDLWELMGRKVNIYRSFPRLVGECFSPNWHFVHASADPTLAIDATIQSAFEYSGQNNSSCSRLFVPSSLWESKIKSELICKTHDLIVGHVTDYSVNMSAVINKLTFENITSLIENARRSNNNEIIAGGSHTSLRGFFIHPTIIVTENLLDDIIKKEIFGPLLSVYVYKENEINKIIDMINSMYYGASGCIFGADVDWMNLNLNRFKFTAGNLFINGTANGIKVGEQPFGGGRVCGTNDKIGGPHYLLRWASMQTVAENMSATKGVQLTIKNE